MAISDKEAARRIIDALPDDASFDDVAEQLDSLRQLAGRRSPAVRSNVDEARTASESDLGDQHLERRGRFTVLVPNRPQSTITAEMVNRVIDDIRREREDSFLHPRLTAD